MIDKNRFYDGIFWISIITMIIWVILKIVGVINTPPLVESVPTIGTIFAAGVFYQKFNSFGHRLTNVETKIEKLDGKIEKTSVKIHQLDKQVSLVESRVTLIESRLTRIEAGVF